MQGQNIRVVHATRATLISARGINKSIAQDPIASVERGADELGDMVCTGGGGPGAYDIKDGEFFFVGDNVTNPITAAKRANALAYFRFDDTAWTGPLGTVAAGTSQFQSVAAHAVQTLATPVLQYPSPRGSVFSLEDIGQNAATLTAVVRTLANWTPTGIINTLGITLDIEAS